MTTTTKITATNASLPYPCPECESPAALPFALCVDCEPEVESHSAPTCEECGYAIDDDQDIPLCWFCDPAVSEADKRAAFRGEI